MTTAQIVANMAKTPERDFWLTVTLSHPRARGMTFRKKVVRDQLFYVTLQHWPIKVNAPPVSGEEVARVIEQMPSEFWVKIHPSLRHWLHHFTTRHTGVTFQCTGTLDLNPEWTAAIQRIPCHPLAPIAFPPRPAYTPEQIAEGGRIIADMRKGGWLRM